MRMYSAAPKRLKIREDALNSMHRIFGSPDVDGIRPQINTHAERVFHQFQVFVAGPEQGLKIRRNLQCDLQWNNEPP